MHYFESRILNMIHRIDMLKLLSGAVGMHAFEGEQPPEESQMIERIGIGLPILIIAH